MFSASFVPYCLLAGVRAILGGKVWCRDMQILMWSHFRSLMWYVQRVNKAANFQRSLNCGDFLDDEGSYAAIIPLMRSHKRYPTSNVSKVAMTEIVAVQRHEPPWAMEVDMEFSNCWYKSVSNAWCSAGRRMFPGLSTFMYWLASRQFQMLPAISPLHITTWMDCFLPAVCCPDLDWFLRTRRHCCADLCCLVYDSLVRQQAESSNPWRALFSLISHETYEIHGVLCFRWFELISNKTCLHVLCKRHVRTVSKHDECVCSISCTTQIIIVRLIAIRNSTYYCQPNCNSQYKWSLSA